MLKLQRSVTIHVRSVEPRRFAPASNSARQHDGCSMAPLLSVYESENWFHSQTTRRSTDPSITIRKRHCGIVVFYDVRCPAWSGRPTARRAIVTARLCNASISAVYRLCHGSDSLSAARLLNTAKTSHTVNSLLRPPEVCRQAFMFCLCHPDCNLPDGQKYITG